MAFTYAQLVDAIHGYLQVDSNGISTTDMDTIIRQAEQRIYYDVQIPVLKKNVTGNLTANNRYLTTPTDYLATYSIAVNNNGTYEYLLPKEVAFLREAYPSTSTTGVPRYYAIFDNDTFLIGPPPDSSYEVELHYFYEPASIVDQPAGTWISENAENALLYGCLFEAYTYLKGEQDLIGLYAGKYKESLQALKVIGEGRNRSDTYRNSEPRITPN
jgi:hypothetical protein